MADAGRARAVLGLPITAEDSDASTVREFFAETLAGIWAQEGGTWRLGIESAMVRGGLLQTVNGGPYLDREAADALVLAAISQLGQPQDAQSATLPGGPLSTRMNAVAGALDDSGEALAAALVKFISDAMDLSELGRAIGAEADELRARSGQAQQEIGRLRAELARVTAERDQAAGSLNQVSAGAP